MSDPRAQPLFGGPAPAPTRLGDALSSGSPATAVVTSLLDADPRARARATALQKLEEDRDRADRVAQAAREQLDQIVDGYTEGVERLASACASLEHKLASEVLELALIAAREIVGRELSIDHDRAFELMERALDGLRTRPLTLRMHSMDVAHLRERSGELDTSVMTIVEDDQLTPGGFVLETPDRILDATVEGRLERVRAAMAAALITEDTDAV